MPLQAQAQLPLQPLKAVSTAQAANTAQLPPPRLAAPQPPRSSTGVPPASVAKRLAATTAPSTSQQLWACSGVLPAATLIRGGEDRRRASVPGNGWFARAGVA